MTNTTVTESYIQEIQDMEEMKKELDAQIKIMKAVVKAEMEAAGLNKAVYGTKTVSITEYSQTKLDTAKIKAEFPEVYAEFGKTTTASRMTIRG